MWVMAIVWVAAGWSGLAILLGYAFRNGSNVDDDISAGLLILGVVFAIIGPFTWIIVWKYEKGLREKKRAKHI
jgi:membrane protein DedA with SNARE-associated domain